MGLLNWLFDPYSDSDYTKEINNQSYDSGGTVPDVSDPDKAKSYANVNTLHGIFGIPYQFLPTVDTRPNSSMVGRKYSEKILSKSPILLLTPVKQDFMSDFADEDKANALQDLINGGGLLSQGALNGSGKYYTTKFAYDEYYRTVNKMCSEVAYFLGIGDVEVGQIGSNSRTPIKHIDWSKATNDAFKSYYAANKAIAIYLDGNSVATLSDSFSNGTTESSLASTINGYSEQSRELRFLLGNSKLSQLFESSGTAGEITGNLAELTKGLTGDMLTDLASTGVNSVLSGGKMIFPKIWGDSQYSRSYSFDIKLRSPDHDKISIFLNILVPYIHLLGIVLPRSLESQNPNAFQSPLLVKAYCKGMFNIDMGLITDMSVNRGAECQWNDDGLPTQIDISLQIEDLYQSLMLTQLDKYSGKPLANILENNWDLVTNTGMLEFLANMAGLNVADIEIGTRQRLYVYLQAADAARLPSTAGTIIDNYLQNIYVRLTKGLYLGS